MTALAKKKCVPCKGEVAPFTLPEAEEYMKKVPGWGLEDKGTLIIRSFRFKNYAESLEFVCAVSVIAEKENHHPDITFGWGYATILLRTHSIKGLSENDFIIAAKINEIIEEA